MIISVLEPDACDLYPCDPNSSGCSLNYDNTSEVSSKNRVCEACRRGFIQAGDDCVDINLRNVASETFTFGNVDYFAARIGTHILHIQQNPAGLADLLTIVHAISSV
jgi:hypothetical protein